MIGDDEVEKRKIARLNGLLPDMKELTERRIDGIIKKAVMEIEAGTFTPDKAYEAMHMICAYRRVVRSFDLKIPKETKETNND